LHRAPQKGQPASPVWRPCAVLFGSLRRSRSEPKVPIAANAAANFSASRTSKRGRACVAGRGRICARHRELYQARAKPWAICTCRTVIFVAITSRILALKSWFSPTACMGTQLKFGRREPLGVTDIPQHKFVVANGRPIKRERRRCDVLHRADAGFLRPVAPA
jgi:hypothetical protein